jgi:hypothetical protein
LTDGANEDHSPIADPVINRPAGSARRRLLMMGLCLAWVFVVVGAFGWIRVLNSQSFTQRWGERP